MNQLLVIINEMLEESGKKSIETLEHSLNLRDDLNMDSLMLAELTVRIENECDVDIFEDGIVETIGEIITKLEGK
ncbi:phosphopantetheine-binding protein [Paenibacillus sp. HWE-109]|uniref:acyl carrier protein n=1 Tax=Paenibacillus sp. HWE-109 TaxID=1306526 RepID=UPI001EDF0F26|nr:phosphopantetheine-binding protein [Paenibacillus sp. HWE-109]UKS25974.1 phosphopantetheine-binding protein [Paenibacillus sp. HWE-109]